MARTWEKGSPPTLLVGMLVGTDTVENNAEVPQKIKMQIPYDSANLLLGIHPEATKSAIQNGTCAPTLTAALLTTAKTREQPQCPWGDEETKKWHVYT